MLRVALTGGIGSGKSTVSALLAARGATVIDADLIARDVVAPGTPGLRAVVDAFGPQVLRPDGSLDREGLGRLVFSDPDSLARLNAIVHPLVGAETVHQAEAAEQAGSRVLVYDVPLLVENNLQALYEVVVVVAVEPGTQLARLTKNRGMTEQDVQARMQAQAPAAERLAAATHVIDNDGSLQALEERVDAVWALLVETAQDSQE
jgi:dephospho-CoA kinase